jgi:hypothetical protein
MNAGVGEVRRPVKLDVRMIEPGKPRRIALLHRIENIEHDVRRRS